MSLWGDHGWKLGEHNGWCKQTNYEIDTRAPLIISAPGMSRGERCGRPVELLSLYPTLIELCGIEKRDDLDGVSIAPLLKNPDAPWARPAITTLGKDNHAIRTERWRYIRYADGGEELYDRDKDPQEWRNLAGESGMSDVKKGLAKWFPKRNADARRGGKTGKKKKNKTKKGRGEPTRKP